MAGLSQGGGVGLALANWMTDRRPAAGHLGHGRRPLRRLGQPRLHQRQGARELQPSVPHHVPERGAPRRPPAAHHADLRPAHRAQRRVGRRLRARAPAVVPAAGRGTGRGRHVPPLERVPDRRRGVPRRARAGRPHRVLELRQVPGHRATAAADWLQGLFTNRLPEGRADRARRRCSTRRGASSASSRSPASATTSSSCSARRPPRCTTPAGSSTTSRPTARSGSRCSRCRSSVCRSPVRMPRDVLQSVTAESLATADFPFMAFRQIDIGMIPAWVGRMTYSGDLGYEIWVRPRAPAGAVRPAVGGRAAVRHGAVRVPGADVDADGEEVRHLVPGVPADLHAARGRHGPLPASSTTTSSGAPRVEAEMATRAGAARSSTSRSTPTPTSPPT